MGTKKASHIARMKSTIRMNLQKTLKKIKQEDELEDENHGKLEDNNPDAPTTGWTLVNN